MRLSTQDRQEVASRGLIKLLEICKDEEIRLTESLKKATDIKDVRYIQGQIEILSNITSLKKAI